MRHISVTTKENAQNSRHQQRHPRVEVNSVGPHSDGGGVILTVQNTRTLKCITMWLEFSFQAGSRRLKRSLLDSLDLSGRVQQLVSCRPGFRGLV